MAKCTLVMVCPEYAFLEEALAETGNGLDWFCFVVAGKYFQGYLNPELKIFFITCLEFSKFFITGLIS